MTKRLTGQELHTLYYAAYDKLQDPSQSSFWDVLADALNARVGQAAGDNLWQRCLSLVERCREKTPDKWDFAYELEQICKRYHVEQAQPPAEREKQP